MIVRLEKGWICYLISFGCSLCSLKAQVQTSLIVRSGMVVQRNHEIPIWGTATAGSKVYAEITGVLDSTIAGSSGEWEIRFPSMTAGGPYLLTIISGNDTIRYSEVYVGDVWLASGQSNMAMLLSDSENALQEISGSNNPMIRQFHVTKTLGGSPAENIPAGSSWTPATPQFVGNFSAVGYYFAKSLHEHLHIPIGIINASLGGARIETWMSETVLGYDEENIEFGEGESYLQPTLAYNTMLHPLTRVPIKGFIWYQGESNMGSREAALMYTGQLKKLITSWRELWSLGDLPFLWVQIPNTGNEANENSPGTWDALPLLRAAQSRVLSLSHTGEAITIDTGEPDIHPTNKKPVGERLALVARAVAYSDTLVFSGPRYKSHKKLADGKIEITFDHAGSGLVAKDTVDNSLRWFTVTGNSGMRYPANAQIDSNKVVVWNSSIPNPSEIRYAWEYNPYNTNFYNGADLPAAPFKFLVNHPGFKIEAFKSTDYTIDKGESTVLSWLVFGAEETNINGVPVDTIGGWRVWPEFDSTFTLRARKPGPAGQEDSVSIKIKVMQPDPILSLRLDAGEWIPVNAPLTIRANAFAPLGGRISSVTFFVDGVLVDSIDRAPYETRWVPESTGEYELTGMVTEQSGLQSTDTLRIVVYNLQRMQYEAEDAILTGGKRILDSDLASGGQFVDFTRDWTLTFPGIEIEGDTVSQLTIRYMVNYGSPRVQNIRVNGDLLPPVVFEGPEKDQWKNHYALLHLKNGVNEISIEENWGYIRIDYIAIETQIDSLGTRVNNSPYPDPRPVLDPVFPNPFNVSTIIGFSLPQSGLAKVEIYDLSGRKVEVVTDRVMDAGTYRLAYSSKSLEGGIYFLTLRFNQTILVRKMIKY